MAGRREDPASCYRVSVHSTKGYRYAATQPYKVDPKTGKKKHYYVHWGTVTQQLKYIPNQLFRNTSYDERIKLVFPSEWDISEATALNNGYIKANQSGPDQNTNGDPGVTDGQESPKAPVPDVPDQFNNRLYGDIWLMEQIAETQKVREDLMDVFCYDEDTVNRILTLAMFPCVAKSNYNHVASWQRYSKAPCDDPLTDCQITRLSQSITDSHRMNFLKLRIARQEGRCFVACDSTTRSAWGKCLADIHFGKNKDNKELKCTLEVVVYSLETHEPVYYRTFSGNTSDMSTVSVILSDLKSLGMKELTIIFDRGYETDDNITRMIVDNVPFIMCAKIGQSPVYEQMKSIRYDSYGLPLDMLYDEESGLYCIQKDCPYHYIQEDVKKTVVLKCNLYLDLKKRMDILRNHIKEVAEEKKNLSDRIPEGTAVSDGDAVKRLRKEVSFHNIIVDRKTSVVSYEENAVSQKTRVCAGFFGSLSYRVDGDAMMHLSTYKLRDEQEKYFEIMKDQMGFDVQNCSTQMGKTGRLFILFVGLILFSRIRYIWKTKLRGSFKTSGLVLDEMRSIRYVEYPDGKNLMTPFTKAQIDISNTFGITPPAECMSSNQKASLERKKAGRPVGRPKKG